MLMKDYKSPVPEEAQSVAFSQKALGDHAAMLQTALTLHKQGRLDEAEALYREILLLQPRHFDALQLLATLSLQNKNFLAAVELFEQVVTINPNHTIPLYNFGVALHELKRYEEAVLCFDRIISLKPDYAEACNNRGNALKMLEQLDAAVASYDRAIALKPDFALAYYNKGVALQKLKQLDNAVACYEQATALKPDYAEAYNNRGNILQELGRLDDAVASYNRAIALKPGYAEACYNLGNALLELRQPDDAVLSYNQAIAFKADYAEAYYNRGNTLRELQRYEEALAIDLATNPEKLRLIRQTLEQNRLTTPLFDTQLFTRHIEDVFSAMYGRYQEGLPPEHLVSLPQTEGSKHVSTSNRKPAIPVTNAGADLEKTEPCLPAKFMSDLNVATTALAAQTQGKFQQALQLHQSGQLAQAQLLYEEVLQSQPEHFDALHLAGVIASQTKNYQTAAELIGKAIAIYPGNAAFYNNRGNALKELKQLDDALAHYDHAIALKPDYAEAYYNRGNTFKELTQLEAAVANFDQAIALKPDYAEAYCNRGVALLELKQLDDALANYDQAIALKPGYAEAFCNRGYALEKLRKLEDAVTSFDRAIALKPDYAEAYYIRGNVLQELKRLDDAVASFDQVISLKPDYAEAYYNRGNVLQELKLLDDAVASYDRAIALKPDFAGAYNNRGNALQKLRQLEDAVASYNQAIALKPDDAKAYCNCGVVLRELGKLDDAVASYDRAIALKPDYPEACNNLGVALENLGKLDDAVASYNRAIALKPDYAEAYWNKSLALLLGEDFNNGWELYEWRWKTATLLSPKRDFPQPLWSGKESLAGKTILLHSEQGLGDTIQFCRYARSVADVCDRVILEVEPPLIGLLQELAGVADVIAKDSALPPFDYHCPLLSLPLAFKTDLHSIPFSEKYLRINAGKLAYWAKKLGERNKPRVGIVWSGNATHKNDYNRSIPLADMIKKLPSPCQYVSLQKEVRDSDQSALMSNPAILHFGNELHDFADTAALSELMDVVISVDTSVAHLSGALGKTTWILLPFSPDWRWLLNRDDSPWYKSVTLYRQPKIGEWESVLANVSADLANRLSRLPAVN